MSTQRPAFDIETDAAYVLRESDWVTVSYVGSHTTKLKATARSTTTTIVRDVDYYHLEIHGDSGWTDEEVVNGRSVGRCPNCKTNTHATFHGYGDDDPHYRCAVCGYEHSLDPFAIPNNRRSRWGTVLEPLSFVDIPRMDPDDQYYDDAPPRPAPVASTNGGPSVMSLQYFADKLGVSKPEARIIRAKMADNPYMDPPVINAGALVPEAENGIHNYWYVDHIEADQ